MRRSSSILAVLSLLSLATAAGAEDDNPSQGKRKQFRRGGRSDLSQLISGFKKQHGDRPEPKKNPIPIDPGRGDGRVPVSPVPITPPAVRDHRDGASTQGGDFVFVNGHWERVKAPQVVKPKSPFPPGTVVRDHRTPNSPFPAGATVRDHRTTSVIRDHRTTPVVRDHRTTPVIRDHRTGSADASGGVTVTVSSDQQAGPIVRDHRTQPTVRDHRTGR